MASYGLTAAGFVVKPQSQILSDMQARVWATIDPTLDLSPQTPDGQFLGIYADDMGAAWELLQVVYNQFNREDAEGAALDNLGDVIGVPREGESYTQVYCTCGLSTGNAPYAAGALVANIAGLPAQTFTNVAQVPSSAISGGLATVLFQSTTIGVTPAVNPGTLTAITTPVTGWSSITNPLGQSQLGQAEETDAAYGPRQGQEVAAEGSCSAAATAAALVALGATQQPPQTLAVTVLENTSNVTLNVQGITMPPHTFAPVIWDGGTGWAAANASLIAAVIYANQPAGITCVGSTTGTVLDPILGTQTVSWTLPTGVPLFVSMTVVPRAGVTFTTLQTSIRAALVAAAVAPTPASGVPPIGQLSPGAPAIGSQLSAIVAAVVGVYDIQSLSFDTHASPSNTSPITIPASTVLTITAANAPTDIVIAQGAYP